MPERHESRVGLWNTVRRTQWHQWGRLVAALILLDQWVGPLGSIPSSEAIIVVALGALFAPVPVERRKDRRDE